MEPQQKKKILIVDDEASLLKILSKFLEKLNFAADTAETGEKGLELFQAAPQDYYGIIIDYNLPGSSSNEILKEIKALNPNIRTVLSTGFAVDEILNQFETKIDSTLQKPFTFAEFQKMISEL